MSAMGPACKKNVSDGAAGEYTFADGNNFVLSIFTTQKKTYFFLKKFELFS